MVQRAVRAAVWGYKLVCKVAPVILHGVVSPDAPAVHRAPSRDYVFIHLYVQESLENKVHYSVGAYSRPLPMSLGPPYERRGNLCPSQSFTQYMPMSQGSKL